MSHTPRAPPRVALPKRLQIVQLISQHSELSLSPEPASSTGHSQDGSAGATAPCRQESELRGKGGAQGKEGRSPVFQLLPGDHG